VFRLSPRISKVFRVTAKQAVRLLFSSWVGIFGWGLSQSSRTIYAAPSWRRHSLVICASNRRPRQSERRTVIWYGTSHPTTLVEGLNSDQLSAEEIVRQLVRIWRSLKASHRRTHIIL
jgi:hypothetical protein